MSMHKCVYMYREEESLKGEEREKRKQDKANVIKC